MGFEKLRVMVLGCGSIGKRHIGNLRTLGVEQIVAVDPREDRRQEVLERFGVTSSFASLEEALSEDLDAAILCLPTAFHIEPAMELARRNVHIFMEKPISHTMEGVDGLIEAVTERDLVMVVGYIFRWAPTLRKVKELLNAGEIGKVLSVRSENSTYLPDWHPWEDYRDFYMSKKDQGGGVLLDSSHTIDWCHWLFGDIKSVYCLGDHVSNLEIDTDDIAEMVVRFESGVFGSIHLDMLGRVGRKNLEVIGSKGTLLWDFSKRDVEVYHGDEKRWDVYPVTEDFAQCYVEEMRDFLTRAQGQGERSSLVTEGRHTMLVIEAARESSRTGRAIDIA